MLETFNPDNEMLLATVQELTAELATAQGKIAELEKGGGGGVSEPYITITGYRAPSNLPIYNIQQHEPDINSVILEIETDEWEGITYETYRYRFPSLLTKYYPFSEDSDYYAVGYDGAPLAGQPIYVGIITADGNNYDVGIFNGSFYILKQAED